MESGVVVVDGSDETIHAYLGVKFFHNFASESLLHSLAGFGFASRYLPPVLVFAIPALGSEDLSFRIADDRCYYCDRTLEN